MQFDFHRDRADVLEPLPSPIASTQTISKDDATKQIKTFKIEIFPAPNTPHLTYIRDHPLYGPWPEEQDPVNKASTFVRGSLATAALHLAIPKDMAARGLSDWETGSGVSSLSAAQAFTKEDYIQLRQKKRLAKGSAGEGLMKKTSGETAKRTGK